MNQPSRYPASPPYSFKTSLVGRAAEVDAIERRLLIDRARLISITGPGGVGKTHLALHVADRVAARFRDGCAFAFLASTSDHRLVPLAIERALGLRLSGDLPPEQELIDWLADRELLLVADTFEHLLPAGSLLSSLTATCPGLSIVVTSRSPLGLSGEAVFRVAPLATPPSSDPPTCAQAARQYDAVALFEDRAGAASPGFTLTDENAVAIAEICRRLDGLPLAIELVAARARALPPGLMLRQIEEHRDAPGFGARDAQARHRTMSDAIGWSYHLLSPDEQELFRAISVFQGQFTARDAFDLLTLREVSPANPETLRRRIATLAGASLLVALPTDEDDPTYVMLGLLREYGHQRSRDLNEEIALQRAHARWVATRLESPDQPRRQRVARIDLLREEIRAAIAWSLTQPECDLAEALLAAIDPFWIELGRYQELRAWLELAATFRGSVPPSTPILLALARVTIRQGELARSLTYAERAFQSDDRAMLAEAALAIAVAEGRLGNHDRSQAMGGLALESLRERSEPRRMADAQSQLAHLALLRGDLAGTQALAEAALETRRSIDTDDPERVIDLLDILSLVARLRGDSVHQSALARQTLELTRQTKDPYLIASGLWTAAAIAAERACFVESARFYGAEEALRKSSGFAIDPGYSAEHAASIASVKAALGAVAFAEQWDAGRSGSTAMVLEEAVLFLSDLADREQAAYHAEKHALRSLGLSDRQQDVLRLIGQGRSDREIAEMLSISARTVSKHVEAILIRVDARTRSGAASIAARLSTESGTTLSRSFPSTAEPGSAL